MKLRRLFLLGLVVAAAVLLARALVRREGVGSAEYVVSIAIICGLIFVAVRLSLRAIRRA